MVYELGHVADRFKNNIGVGDPRKEEGFAGNLHKKRRCGTNNVNKFIGNIAKNYMETTEGENWASKLISHLNSRFIDTPKNFIQQEVQDANLHQIISSHSSLPDLLVSSSFLVSNSFFSHENDMNLGCGLYCPALHTEAFDSITAKKFLPTATFHNSKYRSFTGNKRSAYNMDHPLISVDDVQSPSPYPNSCNIQQSFQKLPEANDSVQNISNNQDSFQPQIQDQQHFGLESSSDAFSFKVLVHMLCTRICQQT
ncbi:hypothetical protein E3N88_45233 [Mikania micrantha]|uniref:Uncharacterized protein n=1 Tax=Mikania micrantha TaxID=192012 RepID=A0A5N6LC39_9ASTR|nr:hypothetical protein E3N88_45233 [Mikania micrantha]